MKALDFHLLALVSWLLGQRFSYLILGSKILILDSSYLILLNHSLLKDFTGLVVAALIDW